MNFTAEIIQWYTINKRDLPWRNTQNAYHIWLSEVILQQTRVDQGLPYYYKFVEAFPTVQDLASASEDEVLRLWQGLGYYSRARNMLATAKQVVAEYKGVFPNDHLEILKLKGIGPYTAAAIVSFAFNKAFPVVDGNVYRVLARFFGVHTAIDSTGGKKEFLKLAADCMDGAKPALYNQAIMEFGAMQCKPASPNCANCPVSIGCCARKEDLITTLPIKGKKIKPRDRHFHYFVLPTAEGGFWLNKRTAKDIWANMYDFPLIETRATKGEEQLWQTEEWKKLFGKMVPEVTSISSTFKHQLTHQTIYANFYELRLTKISEEWRKRFFKVDEGSIQQYALPKLIERYVSARSDVEQVNLAFTI